MLFSGRLPYECIFVLFVLCGAWWLSTEGPFKCYSFVPFNACCCIWVHHFLRKIPGPGVPCEW